MGAIEGSGGMRNCCDSQTKILTKNERTTIKNILKKIAKLNQKFKKI